jgi:hypothetical protein
MIRVQLHFVADYHYYVKSWRIGWPCTKRRSGRKAWRSRAWC